MKLSKVTITGADASVEPKDLIKISKKYPFVEWGILFSLNHVTNGRPRFPSWEWLNKFWRTQAGEEFTLNSSLHLCGDVVRKFATENRIIFPLVSLALFHRVQFNLHGEKLDFHRDFLDNLKDLFRDGGIQLIFQIDEVNDCILHKAVNYSGD